MRNAVILGLAAFVLLIPVRGHAQPPAVSPSPFYSADEYQRAHSLFDKVRTDLGTAQGSTPTNLIDQARADVSVLQNNWDNAVYDSRQMYDTVLVLEAVVDHSPVLRDRANLGDDLSRLLDLRQEYY
jgi:PHD/YefM family antitoxin component YafN of YafNO toxin-antitoxin module